MSATTLREVVGRLRQEAILASCTLDELVSLVPLCADGLTRCETLSTTILARKGSEEGRGRLYLLLDGYLGLTTGELRAPTTPSERRE